MDCLHFERLDIEWVERPVRQAAPDASPRVRLGADPSAEGVSIPRCPAIRFERSAVPLTQTQLAGAVAERAEISKADAKRLLAALDEVVLAEIGNAQKVRIGGLVQLTPRVKPATKKRQGRNPATGEAIAIAAKPATVDLRARPLAKAKGAPPSVQKARRRLAAA
jgi:DNA-binding protein HU-beta